MKKKKRNPNLSNMMHPYIFSLNGVNAFKGNQYIRNVDGHKIIATVSPYNSNTMQHREWQRGYNSAFFKQLEKVAYWWI